MIENEKTHSAKYQVLCNRLTNGTPFTTDTAQARITALADALEITQEEAEKQLSFLCQQGYLIKSEEAGNIRYQKAG